MKLLYDLLNNEVNKLRWSLFQISLELFGAILLFRQRDNISLELSIQSLKILNGFSGSLLLIRLS